MTIEESTLPGVGKKFEIDLDGDDMVIVIHNTGKREVFRRPDPDTDAEKVFEFSDQMARKVGSIVEGAYFQPTDTDRAETTLPGGLMLEWYEIAPGSGLIGETAKGEDLGNRTGVTIIAIQREDETVTTPVGDVEFAEGDTLIVVGTNDNIEAFEEVLADA
jgi:TrkA domain protein